MAEISDEVYLAHYGTLHKSGRYKWGSGDNAYQRGEKPFLVHVAELKKDGLSESDIAKGFGMTTTELRALKTIEKTRARQEMASRALELKDKGNSNIAIGELMGIPESSVRSLLNPVLSARADRLNEVRDILKEEVDSKGLIDIGSGVEAHLGISKEKLNTAASMLKHEGYEVINVQVPQLGLGPDKKTLVKVLAPPGTTYKDIVTDTGRIRQLSQVSKFSDDGGYTFNSVSAPVPLKSSRLAVRYKEDGGGDADGVIYIRPGVDDVSLGASRYVQARIAVDGTHYIKGMAMYRDDLPDGVDIMFNTNKTRADAAEESRKRGDGGGEKKGALKPMKGDEDLPFGSVTRQHMYTDAKGKPKRSVINIVNDEGSDEYKGWDDWSRNLSSQMLSKQNPSLAKQQLDMTFSTKKAQFDEIMSLTNPAVKKKLLEEFAEGADSSAVHLKAAALPGQKTHVILPFNSIKEDEIYAPNYKDGDRVALVRYPHGGTFEIPELTVNNRSRNAKAAIGNAKAAVGINPKVAERLSGADFDGDTVIVIPQRPGPRGIKTSSPLDGLKGFDPKERYKEYPGMKIMSNTQQEMGNISNLITDMTIMGAPNSDIVKAVRHSMVVIDAEKHKLDYKQSYKDNDISSLKQKYQGGADKGASTIISRSSSQERVLDRKLRPMSKGGPIDPTTGQKVYEYSGETYTTSRVNKKTGEVTEKVNPKYSRTPSSKMAETTDAFTLTSDKKGGTVMERLYADHANSLKALANTARLESTNIKSTPYSPSAKTAYSKEVDALTGKLTVAQKNAPLERQAQLLGNAFVKIKQQANPNMGSDELKKVRSKALKDARLALEAKKQRIDITQAEWDAIQAGAITNNRLTEILRHADPDRVKELALPRANTVMNKTMMVRAKAMAAQGYTQAEIASQLGVPTSTLSSALGREG